MYIEDLVAHLNHDIRLVANVSVTEVEHAIREYLKALDWEVSNRGVGRDASLVLRSRARSPAAGALDYLRPRVALWKLVQQAEDVQVTVSFAPDGRVIRCALWVLALLFILAFLVRSPFLFGFLVFLGFFALVFLAPALITYMQATPEVVGFKERFCSTLTHHTRAPVEVIKNEHRRDGFIVIFPLLTFVLAFMSSGVGSLSSEWDPNAVALPGFGIGAVLIWAGLVTRPSLRTTFGGYLPGVSIAAVAMTYSTIPAVTAIMTRELGWFGLVLIGFSVLVLAWSLWVTGNDAQVMVNLWLGRSSSQDRALQRVSERRRKTWLVAVLVGWLICTAATITGVSATARLLATSMWSSAFVLFWSVPIVFVAAGWGIRWRLEKERIRNRTRSGPCVQRIHALVRSACASLYVRRPTTVVEDVPAMVCHVKRVAKRGAVLTISQKTIELLSDDELRAVLFHELWHLKRHSRLFAILDTLSRVSLLGRGLLVIAFDTVAWEYEADRFAAAQLERCGLTTEVLVGALEKMVAADTLLRGLAPSASIALLPVATTGSPDASALMMGRLRLLRELYFGDFVMSYVHPTLDERISHIRAISQRI